MNLFPPASEGGSCTENSNVVSVVVLREGVHGMPIEEYAEELRERLPDHEVRLARTPAREREYVADAEVVTSVRIRQELIERADALKLFACAYAGYGHLPMDTLEERGVAVTTASGVHAPNIAEYVAGSILSFVRDFPAAWRRQARNEWRHYQARELAGSTVTVVGLGAIGSAVVERLAGFDVETIGVRHSPERGGPADKVVGPDELHEVLPQTDYIALTCPLTEETRGLIGRPELVTLPPDAVLVNVARGQVVDTEALVSALRSNRLRGAALDVTDPEPLPPGHPLWDFENVAITPHNAGHTPRYYERLADIVAGNVRLAADSGYEGLENQVLDPAM